MPLHLLGKKSWNVYNTDNVERVRRDEADARAREEAEEQRMQEEDATRRIALLRGEMPAPLVEPPVNDSTTSARHSTSSTPRERKRKRLRGEDETEREIRYAQEDIVSGQQLKERLGSQKGNDAPLLDRAGHIQLVPLPNEESTRKAAKNEEYEAEKAKKRKREEDQVTMRFSNAAGYRNGLNRPWYAAESSRDDCQNVRNAVVLAGAEGKDVWGNDDPRRKEREMVRIASNDPFAMMQQAQNQLKQSEKDRQIWQAGREKEMRDMDRDQDRARRREKKQIRRQRKDDLEGFSLGAPADESPLKHRHQEGHKRHHHHHRHRSRERLRSRERRH